MKRASPVKVEVDQEDMEFYKRMKADQIALLQSLRCSVCYEEPRLVKSLNKRGHYVCPKCLVKIKEATGGRVRINCPCCKEPWTSYQNLFATEFLERFYKLNQVECKFLNCPKVDYAKNLEGVSHEAYCVLKKLHCPARISDRQCHWEGSLPELAKHIAEGNCCFVVKDPKKTFGDNNGNVIQFEDKLANKPNFFKERVQHICPPFLLLHEEIARAFIWLQIERSSSGAWAITSWSLLEKEALENVQVYVTVQAQPTDNGRAHHIYSGLINVLPALSMTRGEGLKSGQFMSFYDQNIKKIRPPGQRFHFQGKSLVTTEIQRWS